MPKHHLFRRSDFVQQLDESDFGPSPREVIRLGLAVELRTQRETHVRRLGLRRGGHEKLAHARDPERHVAEPRPGKVERVERHLRGWLAHRLRGQKADGFARVDEAAMVAAADNAVSALQKYAVIATQRCGCSDASDAVKSALHARVACSTCKPSTAAAALWAAKPSAV